MHRIDRYSLIFYVLTKEVQLTLTYMSAILLYRLPQLINGNYTITYLKSVRWLIESMALSYWASFSFFFYYIGSFDMILETYIKGYPQMLMLKTSLFIIMRYAKNHLDCFVNTLQLLFLEIYCKFFF